MFGGFFFSLLVYPFWVAPLPVIRGRRKEEDRLETVLEREMEKKLKRVSAVPPSLPLAMHGVWALTTRFCGMHQHAGRAITDKSLGVQDN